MILYSQNVRKPCYLFSFRHADFVPFHSIDGFFLDVNEADSIYLDDIIFRDIHSAEQQEELWLNQYYGYVV